MVSSRLVDSSGQEFRHADALLAGEDAGVELGVARLQLVVELRAAAPKSP